MGDIADMMLDGILDEQTGEYLGGSVGYPRTYKPRGNKKPVNGYKSKKTAYIHLTPSEKKIASIRKEIAMLINEQGVDVQEARKQMNLKYGKGWRERGLCVNDNDQWTEEELAPFK